MTIVLNGVDREVTDGATLDALLRTLGLGEGRLAVEINGQVVRREERPVRRLADGDRVEIVQFVGGG
jgi:sulfur carrier protein